MREGIPEIGAAWKEDKRRGRSGDNSPWKKLSGSVMGAESWPALADGSPKGFLDSTAPNAGPFPKNETPPPPPPLPMQVSVGPHKCTGFGSGIPSNKHRPHHPQKSGPKHNSAANGVPPFPAPLPYYQQTGQLMPFPAVPRPSFMVHEYAYQTCTAPFFNGEPRMVKSGCETPIPNFVSTGQAVGIDGNRIFYSPSRGGPNNWRPSYANKPYNDFEPVGNFDQAWRNQRVFSHRESINMPNGIGPRTFIRPVPQFYGSAMGFPNGHGFPGPAPPMCYVPAGPLEMMWPPRYVPHPPPACPFLSPETLALRAKIAKQIEYYFSDENLKTDRHLLSLLDEHGWVPISKIADFNRVKQMTTDIPLILDALRSSSSIEVQNDKIRRRNDRSKQIPESGHHLFSPKFQSTEGHFPVILQNIEINECANGDMSGGKSDSHAACKIGSESNLECNIVTELTADEPLACNGETDDVVRSFSESKPSEPCSRCRCTSNEDSFGSIADIKCSSIEVCVSSKNLDEKANPSNGANSEFENVKVLSDKRPHKQMVGPFSNDFCKESSSFIEEQSTFMLDVELELEQATVQTDHLSLRRRIDDEDDEMDANDQDVDRLIIVTQDIRRDYDDNTGSGESESISNEHAIAINDGLYFYEQRLRDKRSVNGRYNSWTQLKDEDAQSCTIADSSLNSKANGIGIIAGNSSSEEVGCGNSQRRQNKGTNKSHSSHKQRFFPSNSKYHGNGHNHHGIISESPPSNSVGFFFGSTPPENFGPMSLKLNGSAHGIHSGSSPPEESMPKPFPPFQHPSHQLLLENKFKQQKYREFHKHCLNDRKRSGIGCSEEMHNLYKFWSCFLRSMFNQSMYDEFRKLALEDADAKCSYGLECLFRFYRYGLEKKFSDDLYEDFEQLAIQFYHKGNLYGLEKYWAFHFYRDQNTPVKKHLELDRLLREEYQCLEDFREVKKECSASSSSNNGCSIGRERSLQ